MKIYCSGIGGIGLSAYASLQNAAGHQVLGSDRTDSALLEDLRSQGITVTLRQDGSGLPGHLDLFVYSEAIPEDAPERVKAREFFIRQISYFQALGEFSKDYTVIAVCGSHGKSSTTAMAAHVLTQAGLDPTVVVGTKVPDLGGKNWRKGKSRIFLLEACEYRGSFLHLHPSIILVTSLDWDHVDAYPTPELYRRAYKTFVGCLPQNGTLITHMQDKACADLARESGKNILDADRQKMIMLSVPGRHMQENALLVQALAETLGVDVRSAEQSLLSFQGTWRRMEEIGESNGIMYVDDYAHHPKEILATTAAIRQKYPKKRLVCVFQPHMHDRTLHFYDDFVHAFIESDVVMLTDVYEARKEKKGEKADMEKLASDIRGTVEGHVQYTGSLANTELQLRNELRSGDVVLFMGAGDITNLARRMAKESSLIIPFVRKVL
ncbi:MAG: cyanophycin synthetase [Patescibacteria group bacterium]